MFRLRSLNFLNFTFILAILAACSGSPVKVLPTIPNSWSNQQFTDEWNKSESSAERIRLLNYIEKHASGNFSWRDFWASFSSQSQIWPKDSEAEVHEKLLSLQSFDCSLESMDQMGEFSWKIWQSTKESSIRDIHFNYVFGGNKKVCREIVSPSLTTEVLSWELAQKPSASEKISQLFKNLRRASEQRDLKGSFLQSALGKLSESDLSSLSGLLLSAESSPDQVSSIFEDVSLLSQRLGTESFSKIEKYCLAAIFRGPETLGVAIQKFSLDSILELGLKLRSDFFSASESEALSRTLSFMLTEFQSQKEGSLEAQFQSFLKFSKLISRYDVSTKLGGRGVLLALESLSLSLLNKIETDTPTQRNLFYESLQDRSYLPQALRLWLLSTRMSTQEFEKAYRDEVVRLPQESSVDQILSERLLRKLAIAQKDFAELKKSCLFFEGLGQKTFRGSLESLLKEKTEDATAFIGAGCYDLSEANPDKFTQLRVEEFIVAPDALLFAPANSLQVEASRSLVLGSLVFSAQSRMPRDRAADREDTGAVNALIFPLPLLREVKNTSLASNDSPCVGWELGKAEGVQENFSALSNPKSQAYSFCRGWHLFFVHLPIQFAQSPTRRPVKSADGRNGGSLRINSFNEQIFSGDFLSEAVGAEPEILGFPEAKGDSSEALIKDEGMSASEFKTQIALGTTRRKSVDELSIELRNLQINQEPGKGVLPFYAHPQLSYWQLRDLNRDDSNVEFVLDSNASALMAEEDRKQFLSYIENFSQDELKKKFKFAWNRFLSVLNDEAVLVGNRMPQEWEKQFTTLLGPDFLSAYSSIQMKSSSPGLASEKGVDGVVGTIQITRKIKR